MRRVAITGGARGIGAAIAAEQARRGDRVAIGDLDAGAAAALAASLGPGHAGLPLGVTDTASFEAFLHDAEAALGGPLDVLVNNAGIMWVGPYEDEPEAAALKQMDVNFHGVARGMRLALPPMVARGRGHVVNVASAASRLVPAGEATYGATKHAVLGYCTAVRAELRGTGVELSVVMPVVVETELAAGTSHGRGPRLSVQDVADAVARTIDRPRFEVPVPGSVGLLMRLVAVLPQRARDLLWARAMPDQVRDADRAARRDYEARSLQS